MKNVFLLLIATSFTAVCQNNELTGLYTEYKETLLNGEDGSKYTINQKPFDPKLQFEFNEQNNNVIVYNGKNKSEQTYTLNSDTLILAQTFGKGTNTRTAQTKYLITENKKDLVLNEIKSNLDKNYYLKKYYFKKSKSLNQDYLDKNNYDVYTVVNEMPEFPGGVEEMRKFVSEGVKKSNLKGNEKVFLKLLISPEGKISNIDVLNNPKVEYMEEAVKIIRKFPDFTPGKQNGKPVWVYYNFPVKFVN